MAFAVFADGIKTQRRFGLAATAAGLGRGIFHNAIKMKRPA
jgi:hypothetical protein